MIILDEDRNEMWLAEEVSAATIDMYTDTAGVSLDRGQAEKLIAHLQKVFGLYRRVG